MSPCSSVRRDRRVEKCVSSCSVISANVLNGATRLNGLNEIFYCCLLPNAYCLFGTHSARFEKGNKKYSHRNVSWPSKHTTDSGDGIPNYRFPFFGLLTIGTTGRSGTIGTRGFLNVLNGATRLNGLNPSTRSGQAKLNGLRLPFDLPANERPQTSAPSDMELAALDKRLRIRVM
jgi:hypothetical protein